MLQNAQSYFALDRRSLILFRIVLGVVVIWSLLLQLVSLGEFQSAFGLVTAADTSLYAKAWHFSFHQSDDLRILFFLFSLQLLLALLFTVGFYSNFMALGLWLFSISINSRLALVTSNGDNLLVLLFMLCFFLPLGNLKEHEPRRIFSPWNMALFFQVALIYLFSGLHKSDNFWLSGKAIFYILQSDLYSSQMGRWLIQFPEFLSWLTYLVVILEIVLPVLFLLGFLAGKFATRLKVIILTMAMIFHLLIWLTMRVGFFPPYCLAMWLLFLPTEVWGDHADSQVHHSPWSLKVVTALFSGSILLMNLSTFSGLGISENSWPLKAAYYLQLEQNWKLFSPPTLVNRWYSFRGKKRMPGNRC